MVVKTLKEVKSEYWQCQLLEGGPRDSHEKQLEGTEIWCDLIQCHVTEARGMKVQDSHGFHSEIKAIKFSIRT